MENEWAERTIARIQRMAQEKREKERKARQPEIKEEVETIMPKTIEFDKVVMTTNDGRVRFASPKKLKPHQKVRVVGKIILKNGG